MKNKKLLKEGEIDPIVDVFMSLGMNAELATHITKILITTCTILLGTLIPASLIYLLGTLLLTHIKDSDLPKNKIKRFFVDFILFNYKFYKNKKYKQSVLNVKNELIEKVSDPTIKEEIKNSIILFDNLGLYSHLEEMKGQYIHNNKIIIMNIKIFKSVEEFENTLYHELIHYFDYNFMGEDKQLPWVLSTTIKTYFDLMLKDVDTYQSRFREFLKDYRLKHKFNIPNDEIAEEKKLDKLVDENWNTFFNNYFYFMKDVELTARLLSFKRDLKKHTGSGKFTKNAVDNFLMSTSNNTYYDYHLLFMLLHLFMEDNDWKYIDKILYDIYRYDLKIDK